MRCTACGTENRAGSRFCDNCEVRPLLVELRAAPWLRFLDEALAGGTAPTTTDAVQVRVPTEG